MIKVTQHIRDRGKIYTHICVTPEPVSTTMLYIWRGGVVIADEMSMVGLVALIYSCFLVTRETKGQYTI